MSCIFLLYQISVLHFFGRLAFGSRTISERYTVPSLSQNPVLGCGGNLPLLTLAPDLFCVSQRRQTGPLSHNNFPDSRMRIQSLLDLHFSFNYTLVGCLVRLMSLDWAWSALSDFGPALGVPAVAISASREYFGLLMGALTPWSPFGTTIQFDSNCRTGPTFPLSLYWDSLYAIREWWGRRITQRGKWWEWCVEVVDGEGAVPVFRSLVQLLTDSFLTPLLGKNILLRSWG